MAYGQSRPVYRFGDMLALARRSWVLRMAAELQARGYPEYHLSDAAVMRVIVRRPTPVGWLADVLGVTRQAARKVVAQLEKRALVITAADPEDARRLNVLPTARGAEYAAAITEVIEKLNREVAEAVGPESLVAADAVLRTVITDDRMRRQADR